MKKAPLVSLVIPCLNEAGVVERLIDQLLDQPSDELEIIAVDNRSSDATLRILHSYEPRGVRVVSDVPEGVSRARNAGASVAKSAWLVFLDADTLVPDDFVGRLVALLSEQPEFELAAIAYRAQTHNPFFKALTWLAQFYQRVSFKVKNVPLIPGAVGLVKRSVHERINGFDESIRYNEDFDYSRRAYQASGRFKSLRTPFVYFSVRRLENGGWKKVVATYCKAEYARITGKKYDPKEYDMSDHVMK
jgi:glycosyltransferase involved in cell wall biosynthesis